MFGWFFFLFVSYFRLHPFSVWMGSGNAPLDIRGAHSISFRRQSSNLQHIPPGGCKIPGVPWGCPIAVAAGVIYL